MNSDDLLTFLRIAETGSLSRHAIETGASQAMLSRRIAALEARFGTRLLHRNGRGVTLTEHGRQLADHAARLLASLEEIERDMSGVVGRGPENVVIAAQPTVARITFASIAKGLQRAFPDLRIRFREGLGGDIKEWLARGEVDLAFLYLPGGTRDVEVELLVREELSFVAPRDFPGDFPQGFPCAALVDYPLVLPSAPHGLRTLVQSMVGASRLRIAVECDASVSVTKALVARGCGCTVLPFAAVHEEIASGELRAFALVQPAALREVGLLTSKNRPALPRQSDVLQVIRDQVRSLVRTAQWPGARLVATDPGTRQGE